MLKRNQSKKGIKIPNEEWIKNVHGDKEIQVCRVAMYLHRRYPEDRNTTSSGPSPDRHFAPGDSGS